MKEVDKVKGVKGVKKPHLKSTSAPGSQLVAAPGSPPKSRKKESAQEVWDRFQENVASALVNQHAPTTLASSSRAAEEQPDVEQPLAEDDL